MHLSVTVFTVSLIMTACFMGASYFCITDKTLKTHYASLVFALLSMIFLVFTFMVLFDSVIPITIAKGIALAGGFQ